jgi:hypothetical protein
MQGESASDGVLEAFAEKIANTIVQGELNIDGWSVGMQDENNSLDVRYVLVCSYVQCSASSYAPAFPVAGFCCHLGSLTLSFEPVRRTTC